MGVTPPNSEPQPPRARPARENAASPKSETRSKFEEAMRRMREGEGQDLLAGGEGRLSPFDQPVLHRHRHSAGDERNGGDPAQNLASPPPAQSPSGGAEPAVASGSPADIAPSHYEFQNRIGLPSQIAGAETQLTMTDQRWLASQAVVRSDGAGGLSVDIQARSDADAEQQHRESLRSRLEARGHRVVSIEIGRS